MALFCRLFGLAVFALIPCCSVDRLKMHKNGYSRKGTRMRLTYRSEYTDGEDLPGKREGLNGHRTTGEDEERSV